MGQKIWKMTQKYWCHCQKGDSTWDRKVLCTAEEMSRILQSKFWADLGSPALWYLICQSGVTTEQWACGTAPVGDRGIYQAPAFPLLLPLIPAGAVQTQSYLPHLSKTQPAMEKCLSPVPVVAFTVQLCPVLQQREVCLSLWSWKWCSWDIHYLWFWKDKL